VREDTAGAVDRRSRGGFPELEIETVIEWAIDLEEGVEVAVIEFAVFI
jgi:hypothetical protein